VLLAKDIPALRAATVAWLLSPAPPMLFMGEEFGANTPFLFFCDFGGDLATSVTEGRRREFARFGRFADPAARAGVPDPNDRRTFELSKLDWSSIARPPHAHWLALYRRLLALRHEIIAPRLAGTMGHAGCFDVLARGALACEWRLAGGSRLRLWLNLSAREITLPAAPGGALLACEPHGAESFLAAGCLPARAAACYLEPASGAPSGRSPTPMAGERSTP
jgi:1,4-alpha-glucan branching enzyme